MNTGRNVSATVLLATIGLQAAEVRVAVFGLFHPRDVEVTRASGSPEFTLRIPGRIERRFRGRLDLIRDHDEVVPVVTMDLETAVASIVAAESPPGAGIESLRAQAVVARSFLLAAHGRHAHADFCDTTHCQFLREPPLDGSPADKAARTTAGMVLQYEGRVIEALYSADCGGRTRTLESGPYPYFAVQCPVATGIASGHRIGLCQRGSAAMARDGATWIEILHRYFPAATVSR
jgi:peptidoglycan hydrolase-like amidase